MLIYWLAFFDRAIFMPRKIAYPGLYGGDISERARYFLHRLDCEPGSLKQLIALRTVARQYDLFDAEAALDPVALALFIRVAELSVPFSLEILGSAEAAGGPIPKLAKAILQQASEAGADRVRIDPPDEHSCRVWEHKGGCRHETMKVPKSLFNALRGYFRRTAALGCERWLQFAQGSPTPTP